MHRTQSTYITAKAIKEELQDRMAKLTPELTDEICEDEAKLEAYVAEEVRISRELGYEEARTELIEAEWAMIEWSVAKIKKDCPNDTGLAEIDRMIETAKWNVTVRDRIAVIALKLQSS